MSFARWKPPAGIKRLCAVSFWADVCSEMAYPVLPLFLIGGLGLPYWVLGLTEGAAEFTAATSKGIGGWLSDRFGKRRPLITLGYFLSTLSKPLIALTPIPGLIVLWRMVDRLGKGLRNAPRDALIADMVQPGEFGRAYGYHRTWDNAGAVIGILVSLVLLHYLPGQYALVLLIAFLPGLIATLTTLRIEDQPRPPRANGSPIHFGHLPRAAWTPILLLSLFSLANSSDMYLIQMVKEKGFSDRDSVLLYGLLNVSYTLISYPAGHLTDKLGRLAVLRWGLLIFAAVYLGIGQVPSAGLWAAFLIYGCQVALTRGASLAIAADHAPKDARATVIGTFGMVSGLFTLAGNILTGKLAEFHGLPNALAVSGGIAAAALLATFVLKSPVGSKA